MRLLFVWLLQLLLLTPAGAGTPAIGTHIDSQAVKTYFDTNAGFFSSLVSNTTIAIVQREEAVQIRAAQTFYRPPGAYATLPYRVTNTGNASATYAITFANTTGDSYDLTELSLYHDNNGNGVVDPGEMPFIAGNTITLGAGQSFDFVLQGAIATTIPYGQLAKINFTATSQIQGATQTVTDSVIAALGATIQLEKTVSKITATAADLLTYTLTARNNGSTTATGVSITLDGSPATWVVTRDVIPANTSFVALGERGVATTPLYHRLGAPMHTYTSTPPADLSQLDAIGFGFSRIDAGQNMVRAFDLRVNANASGDIVNQAQIIFNDGITATPVTSNSSIAKTNIPIRAATVIYYRDPAYTQAINSTTSTDQPIYVQIDAAQCNADPVTIEYKTVIITSAITGDIETFIAKETGMNTGVFRIEPNVPLSSTSGASGNGTVSMAKNDSLITSLAGCGGGRDVRVNLLIDPYGVVYDGRSNAPINGATVSIINVATGSLAIVFQEDGVTPAPSTVITGATGQYQFPTVAPGAYKLVITPPAGYTYPSSLVPAVLPVNRVTDPLGSYGGQFLVTFATGPVHIDVPMDANNLGGMFVEKTASRNTVELGEFVDYTVKIKNFSGQLLGLVQLEDHLPAGFAYVANSARINAGTLRLNGSSLPEPEGYLGSKLIFNVGSILDATIMNLTYRVRVGPGALQGDGINRAQAFSNRVSATIIGKISNVATAAVQVLPGVFSTRGFIVGRVFATCNRAHIDKERYMGIPGVRIYMEDGTFAISDGEGKYSFYNVRPQTHILKLDTTTLPAGTQLKALDSRNAGDAGSRFVDMKNGQLLRADFAIDGCSPILIEEIQQRASTLRGPSETESAVKARMTVDGIAPPTDGKALPASGLKTLPSSNPATPDTAKLHPLAFPNAAELFGIPKNAAAENKANVVSVDLDTLLLSMDNSLQILSPLHQETLSVAQTNIIVKGMLGGRLPLKVNGVAINESRIGRKSVLESAGIEAWEYIGVDLKPGINTLELEQLDPFGNVRGKASAQVIAPGKFSKISIQVPDSGVPADGKTMTKIIVSMTDAEGRLIKGRIPITLESTKGAWQAIDLNPLEPGLQLFVEDGKLSVLLLSPRDPADADIVALSGNVKASARLNFLPDLRPLIAAGVIEGTFNFRSLDTKSLQAARSQDGFDQELRHFSATSADGKTDFGARGALFLKGKVKGDYLLTLAYDSEKVQKERLFRDIQPDEFYPVYGDDSVKGFDAQSTGMLYVRVDKGSSYVLYGDYTTQSPVSAVGAAPARQLSQYNRSLNGIRTHTEGKEGSVNTFAARTSSRSFTEELPALGVSGYYTLSRTNILPNSEKIEILTRDRNQPAIVLKSIPLTRFTDYEIEPLSGRVIFKAPILSRDTSLNPISIKITYESEQGGMQSWVYGVDGQLKLNNQVEVGGIVVHDENPNENFTLTGANINVKLAEKTTLSAEIAQTNNVVSGFGQGGRVEMKHSSDSVQAQVYTGKTDASFDNPGSQLNKGRAESGVKAKVKIDTLTNIKTELMRSTDTVSNGTRNGVLLVVERNLGLNLNGEIGLRHASETSAAADNSTLGLTNKSLSAAHLRIAGQVPKIPALSVFAEHEQDLSNSDKRRTSIGGDYRIHERSKVYLRHEITSSLGNLYTLNSAQQQNATVIGIDANYTDNGRVFSEYRLRDALTGREAEAAVGLRNQWTVAQGIRVQAGLEKINTFSGTDHHSTAVTGAIDYTANPNWKGSARLELRGDSTSHQTLSTLGLAYKLSNDWTFLGRNAFQIQKSNDGSGKTLERLQLGMAYRESEKRQWDALMRYEYRLEDSHGATALPAAINAREAHIISTHASYQPYAGLNFSGQYAGKLVHENTSAIASDYTMHLLSARADYDLNKAWNVGFNVSTLFSGNLHSRQNGVGAELGHIAMKNLWLSVGYNFFGFRDVDLANDGHTNQGLYLRLRFKFDERAFQ